tara:strand:+ start:569 stop:1084 length:516 start_codon:yes stop_codon:yes gene_type:complete
MENKINKKIKLYIDRFKKDIIQLVNHDLNEKNISNIKGVTNIINNYKCLQLDKEDFNKKSRAKNTVASNERCTAMRADNSQCTRRKKGDLCFCGTHAKGTPYGVVSDAPTLIPKLKEIQIYIQEINGIICYIDNDKNIYKSEDILSRNENPKVIGKYEIKVINGEESCVRV